MLRAVVPLVDDQGSIFTGRISLESHPWLADHAVMGTVLLPGTAFLELALYAGRELGCPMVAELTLEAPLVVPREGALALQLSVGAISPSGERSLAIHSRPEGPAGEGLFSEEQWTRHASGALVSADAPEARQGQAVKDPLATQARLDGMTGEAWPPRGAEVVEIDGLYEALAEIGFEYGPAFRGLRRAWRHGEEVFAEVSLPGDQLAASASFELHPALLDAALHMSGLGPVEGAADATGERDAIRLPFSWSGVRLHASGSTSLRVCLSKVGADGVSLLVADEFGGLVASVDALVSRESAPSSWVTPTVSMTMRSLTWTGPPSRSRRRDRRRSSRCWAPRTRRCAHPWRWPAIRSRCTPTWTPCVSPW